jgi:hypothetical protein
MNQEGGPSGPPFLFPRGKNPSGIEVLIMTGTQRTLDTSDLMGQA